nr:MAG TPA: hypothetical protein [Caudoviricetes sp.]
MNEALPSCNVTVAKMSSRPWRPPMASAAGPLPLGGPTSPCPAAGILPLSRARCRRCGHDRHQDPSSPRGPGPRSAEGQGGGPQSH